MNKVILAFIVAVAALFFLLNNQSSVVGPETVRSVEPDVTIDGVENAGFFRKGDARIDCDNAPSEAITNANLPEALREDVQVECWNHGHSLGSAKDTAWNQRIEQFGDIQVPLSVVLYARIRTADELASGEVPLVGHSAYFTRIDKTLLPIEEATSVRQLYAKHHPSVALSGDLPVLEIQAVNNVGVTQRVYLITLPSGEETGYLCTPDCDVENAFTRINWKTSGYQAVESIEIPPVGAEQ